MSWLRTILKIAEIAQTAEGHRTRKVVATLDAETAYYQAKLAEAQAEGARWNAHFEVVADLVSRARSSYKLGELSQCEGFCKAAIERMDSTGAGNFDYPYERLAIIYEKQKSYADALRYAELGLAKFGTSSYPREQWNRRILRLRERLNSP